MSAADLLARLQALVANTYDVPVSQPIARFHVATRAQCNALMGQELRAGEDEQLLLSEAPGEASISVYIDERVLARLASRDPLHRLDERNLADYCTALEGISHFQYLVWSIDHGRQVSLLELELQAEVDKYAVATRLIRAQGREDLAPGLCRRLFDEASLLQGLTTEQRERYTEANRHAARFCRRIDQRYLGARRFRPEHWLQALRHLYRCTHHQKMQLAAG